MWLIVIMLADWWLLFRIVVGVGPEFYLSRLTNIKIKICQYNDNRSPDDRNISNFRNVMHIKYRLPQTVDSVRHSIGVSKK
jgi:hypothetical protein